MITLASASPRRRELLGAAGVEVEVRPADVDETPDPQERPRWYVERVARAKAMAVHGERVLAADTIVVLDGEILGKPLDPEAAAATLRRLAGRQHEVMTAVVLRTGHVLRSRLVRTRVSFRPLTDDEIAAYVATGEPLDKAGAYGIQGRGGALVDRVVGSYTNVIGLPMRETLELLR